MSFTNPFHKRKFEKDTSNYSSTSEYPLYDIVDVEKIDEDGVTTHLYREKKLIDFEKPNYGPDKKLDDLEVQQKAGIEQKEMRTTGILSSSDPIDVFESADARLNETLENLGNIQEPSSPSQPTTPTND